MTNEAAILGLLADLYQDRAALQAQVAQMSRDHQQALTALVQENHRLQARLREFEPDATPPEHEGAPMGGPVGEPPTTSQEVEGP